MLSLARAALERSPSADAWFRRLIWSRLHHTEIEMMALARLRQRLSVAVDVGAALGAYTWILSRRANRVFAFEPGRRHALAIERALRGSNVELVKQAVGASTGIGILSTPSNDTVGRHTATLSRANPVWRENSIERVCMTTLDSYVLPRIRQGESVDILKIDVEGFEAAVITGASFLIEQHKPSIICELELRHGTDCIGIFSKLIELGYVAMAFRKKSYSPIGLEELLATQKYNILNLVISGSKFLPNAYVNNVLFEHPSGKTRISNQFSRT